ncbi:MAG TPA: NAD(P)H-binding protein [Streptosporangiaceae bacterium]|nr:NAD(P)H-binding protein [Streptosporangiaceae bacterium]
MRGILAQARRAGVSRVVQLSGMSAGSGDMSNAITAYMAGSERAATESGLAWTILRPAAFMSNTFQWLPQLRAGDVVRAPFAEVQAAMTDPADIAAVAALALTEPGHEDRIYELSGPQALTPADRVTILGQALGRDLRFQAQDDDEARAEMSATTPARYVDAFFNFYADGALDESRVLPTVRTLTGRPPRAFAQWAREHAAVFR